MSTVFLADLPDLATWRPEIARWRMKFHDGFENIPFSLQQSLSYAHEDFYPNIRRIFIILLTPERQSTIHLPPNLPSVRTCWVSDIDLTSFAADLQEICARIHCLRVVKKGKVHCCSP
jgi:hypothetical protein